MLHRVWLKKHRWCSEIGGVRPDKLAIFQREFPDTVGFLGLNVFGATSLSERRIEKSIKRRNATFLNDGDVESRDLRWFIDWAVAPSLTSDAVERLRSANTREYEARKPCVQLRYRVVQRGVSDVSTVRIGEDAMTHPERCYSGTAFLRIGLSKDFEQISHKKTFDRINHERSPACYNASKLSSCIRKSRMVSWIEPSRGLPCGLRRRKAVFQHKETSDLPANDSQDDAKRGVDDLAGVFDAS
jgi:hypothetical protein